MTGSSDARLPAAIGRYRVLKELGRGMMGVVYLAQDPALDRLIALKTIDLAFSVPPSERASFEQRFLGEARVAARLQHPGIVVVHDVGRDDEQGILYIALEYLQGHTLSEMAGDATLPWTEALRIGAGVARALHHAHARSIVHRDVKPANVMLMASGQPKIMDFGIAKVPSMELTSSGQFFGTPLYMSPEQAAGDPLDGRSDLFSLGAVLYFLLTGRHAFGAESVVRVLARVATEEPPPPSALARDVPPAVDALVMRALRKAPAERFASGDAMADAIDALLAGRAPALTEGTLEGLLLEPELAPGFEPLLPDPLAPMPAPGAQRTTPSRRPDAAAGLRSAALSGTGSSLRARADGPPSSLADPALQSMAVVLPQAARPRRRWYERPAPWVAAFIVLLLGGALLLARKEAKPSAPAARETRAPAPGRDDGPRDTPATSSAAADDVPEGSGRLEVDFEHHLRRGRIQLWVDEDQALDTPFDSRVTQQILSLRLRKGNFQKVLPVDAGRHEVRVRLSWSGRVRESAINGTFAAGQSRTLEVRVSRVLNDLSLKWQ